ncbi:hypothetical protein B0I31_1325 [Saccharothrix carnea]|uniref:Uncharacterized protein n=1 Tax=Saccharothrix carnea TaxID=1280637 RepID=A0A2P8HAA9_SACCR|nr:hypothetical protein [Saccharothrix carnea]PSL43152.1 hypothetical protein B0I31_1325 [Saccharothrix carnea]
MDDDPVAVLRAAVDCAVQAVLRLDPRHADARQEITRVLAGYAATVAPVRDGLRELADRTPNGPVSAALGFLRDADDQAAAGDVQAARVFLLAGRTALFRLARAGPDAG